MDTITDQTPLVDLIEMWAEENGVERDDWTVETELTEDGVDDDCEDDDGGESIEEIGFRLLMTCYMECIHLCEDVEEGEEEEEDKILVWLESLWEKLNFED